MAKEALPTSSKRNKAFLSNPPETGLPVGVGSKGVESKWFFNAFLSFLRKKWLYRAIQAILSVFIYTTETLPTRSTMQFRSCGK